MRGRGGWFQLWVPHGCACRLSGASGCLACHLSYFLQHMMLSFLPARLFVLLCSPNSQDRSHVGAFVYLLGGFIFIIIFKINFY